jgi:hypothetical protein
LIPRLNQGRLASKLVDELLEKIHEYDETLYLPTVLGCLDIIKAQLIQEHKEEDEE